MFSCHTHKTKFRLPLRLRSFSNIPPESKKMLIFEAFLFFHVIHIKQNSDYHWGCGLFPVSTKKISHLVHNSIQRLTLLFRKVKFKFGVAKVYIQRIFDYSVNTEILGTLSALGNLAFLFMIFDFVTHFLQYLVFNRFNTKSHLLWLLVPATVLMSKHRPTRQWFCDIKIKKQIRALQALVNMALASRFASAIFQLPTDSSSSAFCWSMSMTRFQFSI